jgi:hypothetical protein
LNSRPPDRELGALTK